MQPVGKLPLKSWLTDPGTQAVMKALMADGQVARYVGGCVRDTLFGRPISDVDIATAVLPEKAIELLQRADIQVKPMGIEHGSVMAIYKKHAFNITTLRTDVETFGRHATVSYVDSWESDAHRRDFTINALYADLDGTFYDPCGGLEDIRKGRIHFIGDPTTRIKEDYLRILRFFRFQTYFGKIPPTQEDLEACAIYAENLKSLSRERVWGEFKNILTAQCPAPILKMMYEFGILSGFLSFTPHMENLHELMKHETFYKIPSAPIRRLACLLKDNEQSTENIHKDLTLSSKELLHLKNLVKLTKTQPNLANDFENYKILYEQGSTFYLDHILLNSLSLDKNMELLRSWKNPKLPIRGQDLLDQGLAAGPDVGQLLKEVTQWWLHNACTPSKDECLQWVQNHLKKNLV